MDNRIKTFIFFPQINFPFYSLIHLAIEYIIYILSSTLKDKNVQNKPGKKDQPLGIMFLTGEFHNMTQDWKML